MHWRAPQDAGGKYPKGRWEVGGNHRIQFEQFPFFKRCSSGVGQN